MEKLIELLETLGYTADETQQICAAYIRDPDGVMEYFLYLRAIFDDRHEYLD